MKYIEKDFPIKKLNEIARKEGNAKKPIYQIHKWWARRLGSVFRMILLTSFIEWDELEKEARKRLGNGLNSEIEAEMDTLVREKMEDILWEKFYSKNDFAGKIVLDPFMGGGTTIVEVLRLGLKPIGIDINPVAWFVTKKEVEPLDLNAFEKEFTKLEENVGGKIKSYYKTHCPVCEKENSRTYEWDEGNNELADVMYIFWVNKVKCLNPACKKDVHLFPSFKIATKKNKKEGLTHTVFCPKCMYIFEIDKDDVEVECPECGFEFIPTEGYVSKGKYHCPYCGQIYNVLDSVRKSGHIPQREMYAIEYYCPVHGRGYKKADGYDIGLFEKAKKELEEQWNELIGKYIPDQEILDGYNTKQMKNFGYKCFYEMFNERQLLCLSMLFKEILKIEGENLREFMVLLFSDIAQYQNMFSKYDLKKMHTTGLFSLHAYWPPVAPAEHNVWGAKLGARTFSAYYDKMIRGKKYNFSPYEIVIENGKSIKIKIEDCIDVNDDVILKSQTSEDLSFINQKIDAIITDPPLLRQCDVFRIGRFLLCMASFSIERQISLVQSRNYQK